MKKYGNADLAENSINSLILVTKLKGNQNLSILKYFKNYSMKNNETVDYAENFIKSLLLVTKLKGNQNFSILWISKIVFNEK